ncbi:MAG: Gfo/Idh/MocA family oxidoreductase [Spirochaetota bacterium]
MKMNTGDEGKLRIGVIGVGHMGTYHVNVIRQISSVELAGVYDANTAHAAATAARYETNSYPSVDELFSNADAVIVAVPTEYHHQVSLAALSRGLHVLVEKPMTRTVEEARELVAEAAKRSLILQVGHVERFNGAVQELRRIITKPRLIEAHRLGPNTGRIRDVGVVLDLMIHDIDIVLNLVDRSPKRVSASGVKVLGAHEDVASVVIDFDGCIASITASRITQEKLRTLSISEDNAYFLLNYTTQEMEIHRQASSESKVSVREGIHYRQESTIERVFIHRDNQLKLEIEHFIACIRGECKPLVNVENDVRTLEITRDILAQMGTGA